MSTTPAAASPVRRSGKQYKTSSASLQTDKVHDPIGLLLRLLRGGVTPASCWPVKGEGCLSALHDSEVPAAGSVASHRLFDAIKGPPISAIKVHPNEKAHLLAMRKTICHYGWALDPSLAVVICATTEEQQRIQALITRWWKEEFVPLGLNPLTYSSVVLAAAIDGRRWQEVFLSADCLALPAADLVRVVAAATLGLHTLPITR